MFMRSTRKREWIKKGRHLGIELQHLQNRRKNIDGIFRDSTQRHGRKAPRVRNHENK